MRVELSPRFPEVAPSLSVIDELVTHEWLDSRGRVVGARELYTWSAKHGDLAGIVRKVLHEFSLRPPIRGQNLQEGASSKHASSSKLNSPPPHSSSNKQPSNSTKHEHEDLEIKLGLLPLAELQGLLEQEYKFNAFFAQLDLVTSTAAVQQALHDQNVVQARKALALKPALEQARQEVLALQTQLTDTRKLLVPLKLEKNGFLEKYSSSRLACRLGDLAEEVDEESEEFVNDFLDEEDPGVSVNDFFKKYVEKRTLFHTRKAKVEMLLM